MKQIDVMRDTIESFQSLCRLRVSEGWKLDSWNTYVEVRGGGRIGRYEVQMVCSVWIREPK